MLIDTSVWVEFFKGTELGNKFKDVLRSEQILFLNPLTIAELSIWSEKQGQDTKKILEFVYNRSRILELPREILESAGMWHKILRNIKNKIGIIDVLIYISARVNNLTLLTKDYDFVGLAGVELLK